MLRFGLAVVATTFALDARADDVVRFRVEYHAPRGLPDARSFMAGITGRTDRARIAQGPDAALVEVDVKTATGTEGRVRISGPGREKIERSVRGAGCTEIVDALALITALAFDPEASSESRPPKPAPEPAVEPQRPPPLPSPKPEALTWWFDASAGLVVLDTSLPSSNVGFVANVGASAEGDTLAPKLYLFGRRVSGDVQKSGGSADFSILSFGLGACPIRVPSEGAFSFRPCAGFELGALSAEGVGLLVEKRQTKLWAAPLVSGRGEVRVLPEVFVAGFLRRALSASSAALFFESGEKVHDIPRISTDLALEVGVVLR